MDVGMLGRVAALGVGGCDLRGAVLGGLQRKTCESVCDWAEENIYLDAKTNAFPGRLKLSRTPYLEEMLEAFGDWRVRKLTFKKCTQVGGTLWEAICVAYAADQDPGPTLMIFPDEAAAGSYNQERLSPLLKRCKALAGRMSEARVDNTRLRVRFDRMDLYMAWAGSPASLASRPVRYLKFDEVDKYPPFSGREADPVKLGEERQKSFWNAKTLYVSTPTVASGYITGSYGESDRRRFHVPCAGCGVWGPLEFARLKWPEGATKVEVLEGGLAEYECGGCGHRHGEGMKRLMLRAGVWVPEGGVVETVGVAGAGEVPGRYRGGEVERVRWVAREEGINHGDTGSTGNSRGDMEGWKVGRGGGGEWGRDRRGMGEEEGSGEEGGEEGERERKGKGEKQGEGGGEGVERGKHGGGGAVELQGVGGAGAVGMAKQELGHEGGGFGHERASGGLGREGGGGRVVSERVRVVVGGVRLDGGHRGYHLNALYSPWVAWSATAAEFMESHGDRRLLMNFYNSWLGEEWREVVAQTDDGEWEGHLLPVAEGRAPEWAIGLTVGCDIGGDYGRYVVRAWGAGQRSCLVAWGHCGLWQETLPVGMVVGSEAHDRWLEEMVSTRWAALDGALFGSPWLTESGRELPILKGCCDSRYRKWEVRAWCSRRYPVMVPTQGAAGAQVEPVDWRTPSAQKTRKPGKSQRYARLDTGFFKDQVAQWYAEALPGYYFPAHVGADFRREFFSEEKVIVRPTAAGTGKATWQKKRTAGANHYWDCEVYACAAAYMGNVRFLEGASVGRSAVAVGGGKQRENRGNVVRRKY